MDGQPKKRRPQPPHIADPRLGLHSPSTVACHVPSTAGYLGAVHVHAQPGRGKRGGPCSRQTRGSTVWDSVAGTLMTPPPHLEPHEDEIVRSGRLPSYCVGWQGGQAIWQCWQAPQVTWFKRAHTHTSAFHLPIVSWSWDSSPNTTILPLFSNIDVADPCCRWAYESPFLSAANVSDRMPTVCPVALDSAPFRSPSWYPGLVCGPRWPKMPLRARNLPSASSARESLACLVSPS